MKRWIRMTLAASLSLAGFLGWVPPGSAEAASTATNGWPHFQEILHLLRKELPGMEEGNLNQAMVEGMLRQLHPQVLMDRPKPESAQAGSFLARKEILQERGGWLQLKEVAPGLDEELNSSISIWTTNRLDGLILDLRYCHGSDYAAAVQTASRFVLAETDLLDFGSGMLRGGKGTNAIRLPCVVLVNRQTSGAAEALAALLRQHVGALVLGSPTANQAKVYKSVDLSNGRRIHIATGNLRGPELDSLSAQGVVPDVSFESAPALERQFFDKPFVSHAAAGAIRRTTGVEPRPKLNEAELVRRKREGLDPEEQPAAPFRSGVSETEKPQLADPILARAMDLLKGIANLQKSR